MADEQNVTFGPYGSSEPGNQWNDQTYSTVREVIIYSGNEIYSMQVVYDASEGKPVSEKKHGGSGGQPNRVKLDYHTEYLVSISGYCGSYGRLIVVKSLTLHNNIKQYGPYGIQEGTPFIIPLTAGKIVGFFGRSGDRLDSIGVYVKPFPTTIAVGPFGTTRGEQWDDGTHGTVRKINIYSEWLIDSIQVFYDDTEGKLVSGIKHGSDGGQPKTFKLESDEFLLSVWGYYGQVGNMVVTRSLGFQSNKRKHGPFGIEEGERFEFPPTSGKIIGFHGRSHRFLTSIGAYFAPFPNSKPSSSCEDKN